MQNNHNLEEGQIVPCTVDKIIGTTVFVKIDGNGEGTITTSEISPGRIRNLRDYVVPGKNIVCKILKIQGDKIYLSLRRVKQSEKKLLLDKISKERSYKAILKTVLKEKADETIEKITESHTIFDFFNELKENQKLIDKYATKEDAKKILAILEAKKEKAKEIKKTFHLSSNQGNGITIIKSILNDACKNSNCQINYIAAGKYRLTRKGDDFKELKTDVNQVLETIEKQAKKQHAEFAVEKN
jgi:translation initiation factor 2 alpha subunit (eIF-2alpha)